MFEKVCEILADKFDADASTMTMETKVKEDLKRKTKRNTVSSF